MNILEFLLRQIPCLAKVRISIPVSVGINLVLWSEVEGFSQRGSGIEGLV